MTPLISQPVFQTFALCSVLLVLLMYAIGFWTAKVRNDRKSVINPEDVKVSRGSVPVEVEHPDVQRLKRAHLNALENTVPFIIIGFLYSQSSPAPTVAGAFYFTFVAARLAHLIFYVGARQPFRTMSFALGAIINVTMAIQVLRAVL